MLMANLTKKPLRSSGAASAARAFLPQTKAPSSIWDNAKLSDIGNNFEIIREAPILEEYSFHNPFLRGQSEFIFFVVKPKYKVKEKKKVVTPLNLNSKLSKPQKRKISRAIGDNIEDFSTFFMEEILPVSLAISSAGQKVDELIQQLIDDKANLPMSFIQAKATQAVCLRIIRRISQKFKLTKDEQRMMFREYLRENVFKI
jgi:hypothetical protein